MKQQETPSVLNCTKEHEDCMYCGDKPCLPFPTPSQEDRAAEFQKDLQYLINRHSLEGMCGNTPDFILAQYLTDCLWNLARITERRETWYGRAPEEVPITVERPQTAVDADRLGDAFAAANKCHNALFEMVALWDRVHPGVMLGRPTLNMARRVLKETPV